MTSVRAPDRPPIDEGSIEGGHGDATTTTPKRDPLIGQVLAGKYAIGEMLGEGAMGRVYRARQVALEKNIAVKVLHRHLTGEERIAKRFHREARAASRLSHPNSLQILDFGATDDGVLYIAMELLDGEDLQTILDHDSPLAPARIASILEPVLRALEEAHRAGIIHRDLKPENVIVLADRSGREHVKVCDFGIAKILDSEDAHAITVDGFVCGTPQYMAPEQARGDVIDHRSDLYAVGVVLYQMLCGVVPFVGENALGIITKHLMEEPMAPRRRRPELGIPASLEAICLRAMAKDPAARWPTAAAMADALQGAVRELGADAETRLGSGTFRGPAPGTEPPSSPRDETKTREMKAVGPARSRTALAAVVVVLALGGIAWISWSGETPPNEHAPTVEPPRAAIPVVPPRPPEPVAPMHIETALEPAVLEPEIATPTPAIRPRRERPIIAPAETEPTTPEVVVTEAPLVVSPGQLAFDEGRRLFLSNDVPGAIERFEEAARTMPRNADAQKQLGRAYMRAGDLPRSIAAYRRYLSLAPEANDRAVVERIIAQHGTR